MAELVLDNKTYQAYVNIARQNDISVTDAVREALQLLILHFGKPATSPLRKRMEDRIETLRELPCDWDDAGSPSISSFACDVAANVVAACDDALLQGLAIFPNTNGCVLMQWKTPKGDACLSILGNRMVYDVNNCGEEKDGILHFSEVAGFVDELKCIF